MPKTLLRGALIVALAGAIVVLAVVGLAGHSNVGDTAPSLPHERLQGPATTLSSLLTSAHGRPALVVFWASWCGPCEREAPEIERFARSQAGQGRLVGVDWSDGIAGARAFLRRYHWSFPVLRDSEGTVGNAYRLTGLPTTFVIDRHGRIQKALRGPQSDSSLRAALTSAEDLTNT